LAKKLIGKFEGDLIKLETPGGLTEYEIEKVEYL
jgi:Transcription elongation factor